MVFSSFLFILLVKTLNILPFSYSFSYFHYNTYITFFLHTIKEVNIFANTKWFL